MSYSVHSAGLSPPFFVIAYILSHHLVYCQYFYTIWRKIIIMNTNHMIAFAQNLRILLDEMSVSEFAKKVGIPQQTISRYLLCQREITLTNLCKIADFFDESIDYLIGRRDF